MFISCGRLGGRWFDSAGRFAWRFFCFFFENVLFWGAQRRAARDLVGFEKAIDGSPLLGPGGGPRPQKPRSWRGKPPIFACAVWALGGAFGAYGGQIRA